MKSKSDEPCFTWSKPKAGFYWKDVVMVETEPMLFFTLDESKPVRYRPLEDYPKLFYTFADTEPTKEGILAFANKYGSLTYDADEAKREAFEHEAGYLATWQDEIREMSSIITLLECWQDKDKAGLREILIKALLRMESGEWDFGSLQVYPFIESAEVSWVRRDIMRDIMFKAQMLLMFWINARFEDMFIFSRAVNPRLTLNAEGVFESYLEPKSLINAMWIQLREAAISASQGERRIKRCEICGKPELLWEYGERKHRSSWHYHTDCYEARKQRQYRERKRQEKAKSKKPASKKAARGGRK